MRALVISNMRPDERSPERGRFVRDQVSALRELEGIHVELFEFPPGPRALGRAARTLRARYGDEPFDIVHAHFGLTAWPALAVPAKVRALTVHGTDIRHPRTRQLTRLVLPLMDIVGAASQELLEALPGRRARSRAQVLPTGVDMRRFKLISRTDARAALGLRPERPCLLFPADPRRPEKRFDRAREVAGQTELLTLGGVDPERVPLWVNAATAVLVPSEREGFGLAVLEALACDVPVLATPVGVAPEALRGIEGTLCEDYEAGRWRAALEPLLAQEDPRVAGRERAQEYSAQRMAQRVAGAWAGALERCG